MLEFLISRPTVIGFAIVGGVFSLLASWLGAKNAVTERSIRLLNKAAYGFMGVSVVLFLVAGLRAG